MAITTAAKKPPMYPPLFQLDNITVFQAQFFDNSSVSAKQGHSQFALKLFAWTTGTVDLKKHEWWRVVQLLDPSTVINWARKKYEAGDMTAEQFESYQMAYDGALEMLANGERCWIGHIGSPPGRQYFIGQFVLVSLDADDNMRALVFNGEDVRLMEDFKRPRSRTHFTKTGSPKLVCLYDPMGILPRQHAIAEANATGRTLKQVLEERLGVSNGQP